MRRKTNINDFRFELAGYGLYRVIEVKSMMNDLYEAFLNKYDIFSEDAE